MCCSTVPTMRAYIRRSIEDEIPLSSLEGDVSRAPWAISISPRTCVGDGCTRDTPERWTNSAGRAIPARAPMPASVRIPAPIQAPAPILELAPIAAPVVVPVPIPIPAPLPIPRPAPIPILFPVLILAPIPIPIPAPVPTLASAQSRGKGAASSFPGELPKKVILHDGVQRARQDGCHVRYRPFQRGQ